MKISLLSVLCFLAVLSAAAQDQKTAFNRYRLHKGWLHQDSAVYRLGTKTELLKAGWVLTENKGGVQVQRTLTQDSLLSYRVDSSIAISSNWKVGEIKHTAEAPDKLYMNPFVFTNPADAHLNGLFYLQIPENSRVVLTRSFIKWSAITIPFAIRPAINDTFGSKVTSDLKIGASVSYNFNWETFTNKRMDVGRSAIGISAGLGFGFGRIELDASTTSLSERPFVESEDGLAFFITPGIGLNLKGFQIVGFYGWDIGLTRNVSNWNYNRRPYIGIGIGVDKSAITR
jgi:hypothetical protein